MAYYHDGVFSHTIPKFVGAKKKILTYFKNHKLATEEELAKTLGLSARTVKKILLELEMEGIIEGLGNEL
jgi:predicted ArsR family transcriptional regulator